MSTEQELFRLKNGPSPGDLPSGMVVAFNLSFQGEAENALQKIKELWGIVLVYTKEHRNSLDDWRKVLPGWFVENCSEEITMQEALRRRSLPLDARLKLSESWSLSDWIHWIPIAERQWEWWDASIVSQKALIVRVVVDGIPFPSESLKWMFKCAGANAIDVIDS